MTETNGRKGLKTYLSTRETWAFALGTSIGWGSLVVTANTYLASSGPAGSVGGLIIGALIMLIIGHNYAYMMKCQPDAGGVYAYCRDSFGYDHGFLASWFLVLTYLAMLWANATSLPLFARYFVGDIFEFGKIYTIFGYDVYLGEAMLSLVFVGLFSWICMGNKKMVGRLMLVMVMIFATGITVCFAAALFNKGLPAEPAFVPQGSQVLQTLRIAAISPWAFIGFESVSHGAEEFEFRGNRIGKVLVISILTTTVLYIFVTLLSVTAYPPQYSSWLEYISDAGNLAGLDGLPAFYAASHYLGNTGIGILMLALLCLIFTSLIGNITALSRLFYALGKDSILPAAVTHVNDKGVPDKAIILIFVLSAVIPFIGRTAIGWIVDVTTIGAVMIYGFVSAAARATAKFRGDKKEEYYGLAGLIIMIRFGIYLLVPNLFMAGSMEPESYFLFVVWSVLGFGFFRLVLRRDERKNFGKSIIVWVALLSLILFVSLVWMNQSIMTAAKNAMINIGSSISADSVLINERMNALRTVSARSILVVVVLFGMALAILLNNYDLMSRKAQLSEKQLGLVIDMANRDPLTGVKSKLAYAEKEKELNMIIEAGDLEKLGLVVCDVNGLKVINDTLGHKAGDEYLQKAAHLICDFFAHSPVYRIGGDEFVVLLSGYDYDNREEIVRKLHEKSVENIKNKEAVVSAGYADYDKKNDRLLQNVFEKADGKMYEEKKLLKGLGASVRI